MQKIKWVVVTANGAPGTAPETLAENCPSSLQIASDISSLKCKINNLCFFHIYTHTLKNTINVTLQIQEESTNHFMLDTRLSDKTSEFPECAFHDFLSTLAVISSGPLEAHVNGGFSYGLMSVGPNFVSALGRIDRNPEGLADRLPVALQHPAQPAGSLWASRAPAVPAL